MALEVTMPAKKKPKQYLLDPTKVKRVQKYLGAKTETEAIEQLLDVILDNEKVDRAHEKLIQNAGGVFHDTLDRLAK